MSAMLAESAEKLADTDASHKEQTRASRDKQNPLMRGRLDTAFMRPEERADELVYSV
jgi:hypothetical protein